MQVRSDAAGTISKGAGEKVQKHLPLMRDITGRRGTASLNNDAPPGGVLNLITTVIGGDASSGFRLWFRGRGGDDGEERGEQIHRCVLRGE